MNCITSFKYYTTFRLATISKQIQVNINGNKAVLICIIDVVAGTTVQHNSACLPRYLLIIWYITSRILGTIEAPFIKTIKTGALTGCMCTRTQIKTRTRAADEGLVLKN